MPLRDYQEDCVAATLECLRTHRSALIVQPTGCGKTETFTTLAGRWPKGDILLLAHRTELLTQAIDKFRKNAPGKQVFLEQAGSREAPPAWACEGGRVIVASVQSLTDRWLKGRRADVFRPQDFGLVIIDEAHHATANSYRRILEHFGMLAPGAQAPAGLQPDGGGVRCLGVTATPNRTDAEALGQIFASTAYTYALPQAISDGWLVPVRQTRVKVEGLDLSNLKLTRAENGVKDFKQADLEALMIEEGKLHEVCDPVLREVPAPEAGGGQGVVFATGVAHGRLLTEVLNRKRPRCAEWIDGTTHPETRRLILERFAAGQFQFIVNCAVLTEGWDAPRTRYCVMARPTMSLVVYMQMLGRVTRVLPGLVEGLATAEERKRAVAGSSKPECVVFDFVGNSRHKVRQVTAVEALAGKPSGPVVERAADLADRKGGGRPDELLAEARAEILCEVTRRVREAFTPSAVYQAEDDCPFAHWQPAPPPRQVAPTARGGATDRQVAFLVKLGVDQSTAQGFSVKQAGAVITKLKGERCTVGQAKALRRLGVDPAEFNFQEASEYLDAHQPTYR